MKNLLAEAMCRLIFPNKCIYCEEIIPEGAICPSCKRKLPLMIKGPMETGRPSLPHLYAAVVYLDKMPKAIGRFKFEGQYLLAEHFAGLVMERQGEYLKTAGIDMVTCVPMHPKKERRRGYNQAELLARALAVRLKVPYTPLLKKEKDNKIQHNLNLKDRAENVRDAYRFIEKETAAGKRILLVDDIYTTGATMAECAKVLCRAGAKEVIGAAIAFVPSSREDYLLQNGTSL